MATKFDPKLVSIILFSTIVHLSGLWCYSHSDAEDFSGIRQPSLGGQTVDSLRIVNINSYAYPIGQVGTKKSHMMPKEMHENRRGQASLYKNDIEASGNFRNGQDYFWQSPSGKLTRQPIPLTAIELDDEYIDEVTVGGAVELSILVDEAGFVKEVVDLSNALIGTELFNRIGLRLQSVRFAPGQIDGVPVKSVFKITVVSEPVDSVVDKS